MRMFLVSLVFTASVCASAQLLNVRIKGRQARDTDYSCVVPWALHVGFVFNWLTERGLP